MRLESRQAATNSSLLYQSDIQLQPGLAVSLFSAANIEGLSEVQGKPSAHGYISLNYFLHGQLSFYLKGEQQSCRAGGINIGYADGEPFYFDCCDNFSNLEILISPERLYELAGEELAEINFDKKMCFFVRQGQSCPRLTALASRVVSLLQQRQHAPLMLHAAVLEYLYWHLSALKQHDHQQYLSARDKQQICLAKERLLSDLSAAPTIAELAKTIGINQCKLKKGFKSCFGKSIYACFQEARMRRAMSLLKRHNVTETAVALGYSNISHFSTAFRKQYGMLPKDARRDLIFDLDIDLN